MRTYPAHEDLSLDPGADRTEDLRREKTTTPVLEHRGRQTNPHQKVGNTMKAHIQRLDDSVNKIDLVRADINAVIRELPDDVPMFVLVDVVNALYNLRNASVLLDKATDTLEAEEAVQR